MNKSPLSNNIDLVSEIITYLFKVKTLKQLTISLSLLTSTMMLFDIGFNNAAGLNALITAYYRVSEHSTNYHLDARDIEFLTQITTRYPGSTISVFERRLSDEQPPVTQIAGGKTLVLYRFGVPKVIIVMGDTTPAPAREAINRYFKGNEDYIRTILEPE